MRIAKALMIVLFIIAAAKIARDNVGGFSAALCGEGRALYLNRGATANWPDTYRACFYYENDCQLLADFAQTMEPNVRWFCR